MRKIDAVFEYLIKRDGLELVPYKDKTKLVKKCRGTCAKHKECNPMNVCDYCTEFKYGGD